MFKIERVGKRGWLNTPVTLVATARMAADERRLKYHGMQVAKVENWRLEIGEGEKFEVVLPNGVRPAVGDTLELSAVMHDGPLRAKWTEVSSF